MAAASDLHVAMFRGPDRDVADRVASIGAQSGYALDVALMAGAGRDRSGRAGDRGAAAPMRWPPSSAALFPAIYLGLPIGALVAVRDFAGPRALFLLMLTVIVSDTAQYYTGRAFGRRPLAPAISPKKTVEGAVGGFVFGTRRCSSSVGAWWLPAMPLALRVAARRWRSSRSASPAICSSRCSSAAPA